MTAKFALGLSHRWRRAAVGLVVALVAAWIGWYRWLPEYRPSLRAGERYGIDVSHHQGSIDWSRVAADHVERVYIKATEGGDHVDGRFAENWAGARTAGIERGAYHFFTLCRPGAEQARHFVETVGVDPDALPAAIDLELAGNCRARPADAALRTELSTFVKLVESATGKPVILYLGGDFEHRYRVREWMIRSLWRPRFLRRPGVDGWLVWQVHGFAHVQGIGGRVDLDVFRAA